MTIDQIIVLFDNELGYEEDNLRLIEQIKGFEIDEELHITYNAEDGDVFYRRIRKNDIDDYSVSDLMYEDDLKKFLIKERFKQ